MHTQSQTFSQRHKISRIERWRSREKEKDKHAHEHRTRETLLCAARELACGTDTPTALTGDAYD